MGKLKREGISTFHGLKGKEGNTISYVAEKKKNKVESIEPRLNLIFLSKGPRRV